MKKHYLIFTIALFSVAFSVCSQDTIYLNLSVQDAYDTIQNNLANPDFVIIDVRTPAEYNPEHLEGAYNIDYTSQSFSQNMDQLDKNKAYLIYCQGGTRSAQAFIVMQNLNFREVYNMLGGINAWKGAGYAVTDELPSDITNPESEVRDIELFPNPCDEILYVYTGIALNKAEIINSSGQTVLRGSSNDCLHFRLETGHLHTGFYFLKLIGNSAVYTEKIFIR